MRTLLAIVVFFSVYCLGYAQRTEVNEGSFYVEKVTYQDGLKNGPYSLKNLRTNDELHGNYEHNQKNGVWTWNMSDGKTVNIDYENSLTVKELITIQKDGVKNKQAPKRPYSITKENGMIKYPAISDEEIIVSKESLEFIPLNDNNSALFDNLEILDFMKTGYAEGTLKLYNNWKLASSYDGNFEGDALAGLKIRRLNYFSDKTLSVESRIIAICPVVKDENKLSNLAWVYFPDIRQHLSKQKTSTPNSEIKTIDDLLFYEGFESFYYADNADVEETKIDLTLDTLEELKKSSKAARIETMMILNQSFVFALEK